MGLGRRKPARLNAILVKAIIELLSLSAVARTGGVLHSSAEATAEGVLERRTAGGSRAILRALFECVQGACRVRPIEHREAILGYVHCSQITIMWSRRAALMKSRARVVNRVFYGANGRLLQLLSTRHRAPVPLAAKSQGGASPTVDREDALVGTRRRIVAEGALCLTHTVSSMPFSISVIPHGGDGGVAPVGPHRTPE